MFRTTTCGSDVEAGSVMLELAVDRREALGRVLARVDHVDEQARAFEMGEELVAEPDAFARTLDQARHVGDGELSPVRSVDRPEHRRERRERVLRNLRLRVRDPPQQRRLAGVGKADERSVGEQLQAKLEPQLLTGHSRLGEPRRLPRRRRKALVPATREPAARATARAPG